MNRRGFLATLAAVAAGALLDPERALWVRGKKLISIPKAIRPAWRWEALMVEPGLEWRYPILRILNTSNEPMEVFPGGRLDPFEEAYIDSRSLVRYREDFAMMPYRITVPADWERSVFIPEFASLGYRAASRVRRLPQKIPLIPHPLG